MSGLLSASTRMATQPALTEAATRGSAQTFSMSRHWRLQLTTTFRRIGRLRTAARWNASLPHSSHSIPPRGLSVAAEEDPGRDPEAPAAGLLTTVWPDAAGDAARAAPM